MSKNAKFRPLGYARRVKETHYPCAHRSILRRASITQPGDSPGVLYFLHAILDNECSAVSDTKPFAIVSGADSDPKTQNDHLKKQSSSLPKELRIRERDAIRWLCSEITDSILWLRWSSSSVLQGKPLMHLDANTAKILLSIKEIDDYDRRNPKTPPKNSPAHPPETADLNSHIWYDMMFPFFYLRLHGDVASAHGPDNYGAAIQHYIAFGLKEGRCASPFFDPKFYLSNNLDIRNAFGADNYQMAAWHFMTVGFPKEGRAGSRVFNIGYYVRSNADILRTYGEDFSAAFWQWRTFHHLEKRPTSPEGISLSFLPNNWSFGTRDQFMLANGKQPSDGINDVLCGVGIALTIHGAATGNWNRVKQGAATVAARCKEQHEKNTTGPTFEEIDRNQYEAEQSERNSRTA
jgi:hypothetical protein